MCMSSNIEQIGNIVRESNNEIWKVNYCELFTENDTLSRDITYHGLCRTPEWEILKIKTSHDSSKSVENNF